MPLCLSTRPFIAIARPSRVAYRTSALSSMILRGETGEIDGVSYAVMIENNMFVEEYEKEE